MTIPVRDANGNVVEMNGSGSGTSLDPYTPKHDFIADLVIGAKSVALTLSSGAGSAAIPDTAHIIGVKPVSSTAIRIGFETPEADGTKTGNAVAGDFKKGVPVDAAVWSWFNVGLGSSRTLYVIGGTSDVLEICYM